MLTRGAPLGKTLGMGLRQRESKECLRCTNMFQPTGANCKRCKSCRREHELESRRENWHKTYIRKGYNQSGKNNNAWKGGRSPQYYQKVAEQLPSQCAHCFSPAVLVHHKDEDRSNSDITNLERLCKRCHQLHHNCSQNLPDKVVFHEKVCAICGLKFKPTGPRSVKCSSCF